MNRSRTISVTTRSESILKEEAPANSNSIEVIVRMRPLLEPFEDEVVWEVDQETNSIRSKVENIDLKSLNLSHPKYYNEIANAQKFVYDNVEGMESRTKDIYNKKLKKIVDSVVQGYNGTIFMYGQTTSGKTFTMLGNQKDPGILPHSLRTLFLSLPKMKDYTFNVSVSYLEIYNENINDLLVPDASNLKIFDDPKFGTIVKGLKRQEVTTFEDAIYLMSYGEEHRKYRETNANEHSSRSHTIYQVFVESFEQTDLTKKRRLSCLNLVDLAGSERLSDNGGDAGTQTGETGHINKSLFLLTNVIKKLADGKTNHIPYRDSKLTRILSNAIGGNSLTTVICAISPALQNYAQTLSTLRFASRAKKVRNQATENLLEEGVVGVKLKQEVLSLKEKLNQSENHITMVNSLNVQLEDNLINTKKEVRNLQKEMEELKSMFIRDTRQQLDDGLSNSSLLDIMNDELSAPVRTRSRARTTQPSQVGCQLNELFFGDPILALVEQVISESSRIMTTASIDNASIDNSNMKEWSALCLKAKQNYLKDLKTIQRNFASTLDELSQKFIGKEQSSEVSAQIRNYAFTEFQKNDTIQNKISEHIRKISPTSLKDLLNENYGSQTMDKKYDDWLTKDQPLQNAEQGEFLTKQLQRNASPDANINQHYSEVLDKLEKKYDEIYNLVTQSLLKGKESSGESLPTDPILAQRYSFESSYCTNNSASESLNQSPDSSVIIRNSESNSPVRSPDQRKIKRIIDERPSSIGKTMPRFESSFARLRSDRERKSINSLTEDMGYGNVYLWGSGKDGRLGSGRFNNESIPFAIRDIKFSKVECGYHNTFGISQEGLVYGWGRNENGQLGTGSNVNTPIPINITVLNKITIVDIACGWQHCLALSIEGVPYSWGCGDEGQLGHGDNYDLSFPAEIRFFEKTQVTKIACGHSQSAAITSEGQLYTWGHNSDYRLMNSNPRSHFIPTLTELYKLKTQTLNEEDLDIISISMGATHMAIVTNNGNVYTAGRGYEGQLGKKLTKTMKNVAVYKPELESEDTNEEILCSYFTQVENFGAQDKAVMTACGEKFTLILNEASKVYSFGDASDGCLGIAYDEKERNIYQPRLVERLADVKVCRIVAGPRHAACISQDGELYCWGFNYYDHLEVGETNKEYYLPKKIDKFPKQKVFNVSCGYFHTASLNL